MAEQLAGNSLARDLLKLIEDTLGYLPLDTFHLILSNTEDGSPKKPFERVQQRDRR